MSADRWTECPACKKEQAEKLEKMTAAEYIALERKGRTPERETFREDYEIGLHKGKFQINYHGECQRCGFKHTFKHEETV